MKKKDYYSENYKYNLWKVYKCDALMMMGFQWLTFLGVIIWALGLRERLHQLQDISEAASLFRRVWMGDQPNSDMASSPWWGRGQREPRLEPGLADQVRGLGFIWMNKHLHLKVSAY